LNKICKKCKKSLPISDFYNWCRSDDGKYYWCKKCQLEYNKIYRNSDKGKLTLSLQRQHRRGIIEDFTYKEWKQKLEKTEGFCPECGKYVGIRNLTLDHIIPINAVGRGFIYTIDDVQPLCHSCNSKKSDKIII